MGKASRKKKQRRRADMPPRNARSAHEMDFRRQGDPRAGGIDPDDKAAVLAALGNSGRFNTPGEVEEWAQGILLGASDARREEAHQIVKDADVPDNLYTVAMASTIEHLDKGTPAPLTKAAIEGISQSVQGYTDEHAAEWLNADPADEQPRRYGGAPSFHKAWEGTLANLPLETDRRGQTLRYSAAGLVYRRALPRFPNAHPLSILPEQVNAIPMMDVPEVVEYGQIVDLPLDPLYIDFTDERGRGLVLDLRGLNLRGFNERYERAAKEAGLDRAIPAAHIVGVLLYSTHEQDDEAGKRGLVAVPFTSTKYGVESPGGMMIDRSDPPRRNMTVAGAHSIETGMTIDGTVTVYGPGAWTAGTPTLPASVCPALPKDVARDAELWDGADGIAALTYVATERALSCIQMLASANVEIVSARTTMEKRDVKRADKRGWPIADTVFVRVPRRRVRRHPDAEDSNDRSTRVFTHRFEVVGHHKHFQHGAAVVCRVCMGRDDDQPKCERCKGTGLDPAKITPCARRDEATGELTCPNGCRKVWNPPAIKGPEDKPLVPKARRVLGTPK